MAQWLSWLERRPVTAEVTGSSPAVVAGTAQVVHGSVAQLVERNLAKVETAGSSPVVRSI